MSLSTSPREEGIRRATTTSPEGPDPDTGHRLRTPSTLHAFNRYEPKYLVPVSRVADVRAELTARMRPDRHGGGSGYGVWSVYHDTRPLRFYHEKIEGLRFRRKLRVRRYGEVGAAPEDTPVSVEIKQRATGSPRNAGCSSPTTWRGTCATGASGSSTPAPTSPSSTRSSTWSTGSTCAPPR
nr:VTC domain-containing protein [Nocardiopsis sp. FIRDI 009]